MRVEPIPARAEVLATGSVVIHSGSHESFDDGHCALEVVAWLAGETHGDRPRCCSDVIAEFVRSWNDALPSNAERARLLIPLLPLMVGTRGSVETENQRAYLALDWMCRVNVPAWLWLSPDPELRSYAETIRSLPAFCDPASTAAALPSLAAAWAAAGTAAGTAARTAARAAAETAAETAAWDAAGAALQPTVRELQASAVEMVKQLCALGREA